MNSALTLERELVFAYFVSSAPSTQMKSRVRGATNIIDVVNLLERLAPNLEEVKKPLRLLTRSGRSAVT